MILQLCGLPPPLWFPDFVLWIHVCACGELAAGTHSRLVSLPVLGTTTLLSLSSWTDAADPVLVLIATAGIVTSKAAPYAWITVLLLLLINVLVFVMMILWGNGIPWNTDTFSVYCHLVITLNVQWKIVIVSFLGGFAGLYHIKAETPGRQVLHRCRLVRKLQGRLD